MEAEPQHLADRLAELRAAGVEYVFIDTPPGQSELRMLAMVFADLIIIPSRAGELDLAAMIRTVMAAERCEAKYVVLPTGSSILRESAARPLGAPYDELTVASLRLDRPTTWQVVRVGVR